MGVWITYNTQHLNRIARRILKYFSALSGPHRISPWLLISGHQPYFCLLPNPWIRLSESAFPGLTPYLLPDHRTL
ncbi:hypothetical protein CRENBAI_014326 [Crenichthys baileyi]|uniref:Uncharacterized protein n=1 Tax=Crenichthys baileyi TaxID=28760 RepID=A0AAV9SB69_9TELE